MAKLIEHSGFEAVYLSGAGVSYSTYGAPDLGLITQTQMTARIEQMAQATTLPIIVDGDTGYGNAINVRHTVTAFERAGAAAIQLEDQQFPKRCGHLAGKELISPEEMVGKIRAACDARRSSDFLIIGRTDARSVLGLGAATELELVNTSVGIHIPLVQGDSWARMQFNDTRRNFYFIILAMLLIIILIRILIVNSKLGYYFLAIREDEDAAAALGVDNLSYKIASVAISGALTAMGGSFFIQFFGFVDPGLAFGVAVSIDTHYVKWQM